MVLFYSVHLF